MAGLQGEGSRCRQKQIPCPMWAVLSNNERNQTGIIRHCRTWSPIRGLLHNCRVLPKGLMVIGLHIFIACEGTSPHPPSLPMGGWLMHYFRLLSRSVTDITRGLAGASCARPRAASGPRACGGLRAGVGRSGGAEGLKRATTGPTLCLASSGTDVLASITETMETALRMGAARPPVPPLTCFKHALYEAHFICEVQSCNAVL